MLSDARQDESACGPVNTSSAGQFFHVALYSVVWKSCLVFGSRPESEPCGKIDVFYPVLH